MHPDQVDDARLVVDERDQTPAVERGAGVGDPQLHEVADARCLAVRIERDEGVLIIGSGSFTHDLSEFRGHGPNDPAPDWVNGFADWFQAALTERREDDLLNYRRLAPFAAKNHPTEEHLLPLYVALGAAGAAAQAERLHASATYSVLRMDLYAFRDRDEAVQHAAA